MRKMHIMRIMHTGARETADKTARSLWLKLSGEKTERVIIKGKGETAMKVLMINGSPRANGNTSIALGEMEKVFAQEGVETEILSIGNKDVRGCIACGRCAETGKCVFDDIVNEAAPKFEACDGLVVASPVYYASANATLVAFLTRLFYSTHLTRA